MWCCCWYRLAFNICYVRMCVYAASVCVWVGVCLGSKSTSTFSLSNAMPQAVHTLQLCRVLCLIEFVIWYTVFDWVYGLHPIQQWYQSATNNIWKYWQHWDTALGQITFVACVRWKVACLNIDNSVSFVFIYLLM